MIVIKTFFTAVAFVFIACGTANKVKEDKAIDMNEATNVEAASLEAKKMETEKMLEAGYQLGTIVASSAEGDCPFVIELATKTDTLLYDPINLDKSFSSFKQDNMKVWFTFQPLRMMNRCTKANPINLIDIKTRM